MENNFFSYLERLELLGFFSAYPLVYAIIYVIANNSKRKIVKGLPILLPFAYAFVGLLYLGLQAKNLYPDYSIENIKHSIQNPFLKIWAILSLSFWIPALAKKPFFSLLHSFVFFFFLLKDLFLQLFESPDKNIVRNDMKLYTSSFLLNLGALALLAIAYFSVRFLLHKRIPKD